MPEPAKEDSEARYEAAPDHRLARAEALQELLSHPNESDDCDCVAKREQAGLLRGHVAAELDELQGDDHRAGHGIKQQVGNRSASVGRVGEE